MAKRNIAKGKRKAKRQAQRQREIQENFIADKEELAKKQEEERLEQEKVKAKVVEARKKEQEKKENPGFFTRCVDYVKSTWGELKRTQWLDAAQLNKATGSVFAICAVFTGMTWVVDAGLGALAAFILEL